MSAIIIKNKREDLFREISNVLHQWPALERKVFAQAHYCGQTPESISRSLKLDIERVCTILKQCDRELHLSLREFRKGDIGKVPIIPTAPSRPACRREL